MNLHAISLSQSVQYVSGLMQSEEHSDRLIPGMLTTI
jgi:hypothetical protein